MNRVHVFSILAISALAGCASQSGSDMRSGRTSRGSADGMYTSGSRSYGSNSGSSYMSSDRMSIRHDWRPEWGTRTGDSRASNDGNRSYGNNNYGNRTYGNSYDGNSYGNRDSDGRSYGATSGSTQSDGRYWDGQYWRTRDGRYYDGQTWRTGTPNSGTSGTTYNQGTQYQQNGATDVNTNSVTDVSADTYSTRSYFYEPTDSTHVYWYDSTNPNTWSMRPYYRDNDRTYFVERDGSSLRRIFFDDRRARDFDWSHDSRWNDTQREQMRNTARDEWSRRERDESSWRTRWEQEHRTQNPMR